MVAKKLLRTKSRRLSCSERYRNQRKAKQRLRKERRAAKKNAGKQKHRPKKDPGVPNLAPFKNKVLQETEEYKQRLIRERAEKRRSIVHNRSRVDEPSIQTTAEIPIEDSSQINVDKSSTDASVSAFSKDFKKIVESADVIIHVLDARNPLGTRSSQLEKTVRKGSKKLILLLNKADLVPKDNLLAWIRYLSCELPTLAFKSNTQKQRSALSQNRSSGVEQASSQLLASKQCVGAGTLMKLLANYARSTNTSQQVAPQSTTGSECLTSITVGVVGMPNVGKSSVINSLSRARSCAVAATAGSTRSLQTVRLSGRVQLIDSPGLVMGGTQCDINSATDSVSRVSHLLGVLGRERLMLHYKVPSFSTGAELLALLARRRGKLRTGGVPDCEAAASIVLSDWSAGRVPFHTRVPARDVTETSTRVVSQMSQHFDLDSVSESNIVEFELSTDSTGGISEQMDIEGGD